jgi:hypothetical protein
MAAQAPLRLSSILDLTPAVLTSSATIGVDNVFTAYGFVPNQPGVAKWVMKTGGIPVGYPTFTLSVREPTKASRVYKVTAKLDVPTLEQTSPSTASGIQPAPTKAYSCQCVMEWLLPERSTQAERKALLRLVGSLFHITINASDGSPTDGSNTPLIVAVEDFEPVF